MYSQPQNSLTKLEVIGIVVLSALVHLGVWYLYQQSALVNPEPMDVAAAQPVTITLEQPKPVDKTPVIDRHAVMPPPKEKPKPEPQDKPKPDPEPEPKHKPKPKPKSKPKPKPEPKPEPKPQSTPESKPAPEPKSTSGSKAASESAPASDKITPAVSGLQSLGNPSPSYPSRALRRHEEGVVKLKILVEPDGTAGKVTVVNSSGYSELDKAAVKTVKKWRFKAARRGDTPIRGYALQSINFNLRD